MSEIHYPQYRAFRELLQQIHQTIHESIHESSDRSNPNQAALLAALSQVQQIFKQQILNMSLDDLPVDRVSSVQSYRTEMHKQIRLLATDVMFFQTARKPATRQQRWEQITTRLETLIRYCNALTE